MIHRLLAALGVATTTCVLACAEDQAPAPMRLWPGQPPGEVKKLPAETSTSNGRVLGVKNVSDPTMAFFPAPADKACGACVIVCPGGGYRVLAYDLEGTEVAEWLNSIGVHAVLLKYRVPRRDEQKPYVAPLQDAQRCIRLTRRHAKQWGIDPERVGMLGFSAGGNLTIMAAVKYDQQTYEPIDDADQLSAKPNLVIPIYAAYLGAKDDDTKLDPAIKVTAQTPPMFMAVTLDDKMRGLHAALLLAELKKAGVEGEAHIFAKGGHAYGLRRNEHPVTQWPKLCEDWLRSCGWLKK